MFEVVATEGDAALGGDDFDHRLFCWTARESQDLSCHSTEDKRRC